LFCVREGHFQKRGCWRGCWLMCRVRTRNPQKPRPFQEGERAWHEAGGAVHGPKLASLREALLNLRSC